MTFAKLLLTALLEIFPYMSGNNRACIQANFNQIAAAAERGETLYGVPRAIMLSVGFHETHLGCDINEGGNWGAPISRTRRHTAGTPDHAAHALRMSYNVCGTWYGAVSRFRGGLCRPSANHALYTNRVLRLMQRISTLASVQIPSNLH
jgi:hypothetical protein